MKKRFFLVILKIKKYFFKNKQNVCQRVEFINNHKVSTYRKYQNRGLQFVSQMEGINDILNVGSLINEGDKEGRLYKDYFIGKNYYALDKNRRYDDENQIELSLEELNKINRQFDLVICMSVLEHVENIFEFSRELMKVVKSGGYLYLTVPYFYPIHKDDNKRWSDYWRFTGDALRLLFNQMQEVWINEMPNVIRKVDDRKLYWDNDKLIPVGYYAFFKKVPNIPLKNIEVNDYHNIKRLVYNNYEEYLKHQAEKLELNYETIEKSDQEYEGVLTKRYFDLLGDISGKTVLCLGARLGGEVRAFRKNGALSIGIDINPGNKNEFVLYGDFHKLVFPDNSFDIVFTNVLDHVYDLDIFISEVKRVMKDNGQFINELAKAKPRRGSYEVIDTTNIDLIIKHFVENNMVVSYQTSVMNKTTYINWEAELIVFNKKNT